MRVKRSVRSFCVLLLFVMLPVLPGIAQSSDWYYDKPIKSVSFEGLKSIKASSLEGVTSGFVGKKFTDEVYEDLLNRAFALNYFENIDEIKVLPADGTYETCKSISIVLVVQEYPVVSKIQFSGNAKVRPNALQGAISSKEGDIYSENKRYMDERAIRDVYIEKGYTEVQVSSSATQTDGGYVITFTVDEGEQTVVATIKFVGNNTVSANTLKRNISLKEVGLFKKGSFQESMLDQDSRAIVSYYQDRGYVDARVLNYTVDSYFNEEKARRELTIQFNIQEGSRYTFSGVTFTGNRVFSGEELGSLVKLKEGAIYNETRFQEGILAVRNKYYENGYTSNGFDAKVEKDADNKTIGYEIRITEHDRSHIENVVVQGNTRTKEEVVRREIPIESGDIYSSAKITNAMRNLYNLQYFSQVLPEVQQGSEQNLIDLVFNVEEQSTMTLDLGLTFSGVTDPDDFPVSLYAKLQDSNLFGTGRSASIATTIATDNQAISLSYGQNWMFDKPISNNLSFTWSHSNEYALRNRVQADGTVSTNGYYMQFQQYEFNLTEALGRRWTPDFAIVSLGGGISSSLINNVYDDDLYVPYDSSVSDYGNSWEPRNSIYGTLSLDGRNISFDPTAGWFASQRVAWYGLLPEGIFSDTWGEKEFYLRTDTKLEKYFTLLNKPITDSWSLNLVLMAYSGISFEFPAFDSNIKPSHQLALDGRFHARGWSTKTSSDGYGQALLDNSLELRMPLIPGVIALDLFFDASMLKPTVGDFFSDFSNLDDWYFSYGPGLRFCIQQFPLRLLLVNNFQIKNGSVVWEDEYKNPTSWMDSWHLVLSFTMTNR